MNKCLNCGEDIKNRVPGKREKKYCSDSCRAAHYNKTNKPQKNRKYVLASTFAELKTKLEEISKENEILKGGVAVKSEVKPVVKVQEKKDNSTQFTGVKIVMSK